MQELNLHQWEDVSFTLGTRQVSPTQGCSATGSPRSGWWARKRPAPNRPTGALPASSWGSFSAGLIRQAWMEVASRDSSMEAEGRR
jgi:hypothetical protein